MMNSAKRLGVQVLLVIAVGTGSASAFARNDGWGRNDASHVTFVERIASWFSNRVSNLRGGDSKHGGGGGTFGCGR
jgi:hypothetical protein